MKKRHHALIIVIITIAAIYLSTNSFESSTFFANDTIYTRDPYSELRSDGSQPNLEAFIKKEVDQYMYLNFGSVFETTWYDSISGSSATINESGRVFVVQSKGESFDGKAHNYMGGILSYFNDKTLDSKYKVDKVILVSEDFEILKESKIIKW
ncbi:hypothetical protein [Sporosarcina sp. E16_8]|uniref:hypothetical protein n=1 Tax=Sporosarcina sp. E16_8 TaxID=2789295 RepID=UPI001A92C5FD|nr:hypothetical protein [Sporosarcina sp. E16_8]MBO0587105.1 hypothetical protein [Sporosarcina sp. E16_8]